MKQANLSVILQEIKFTWQNTEPIMRPWGIWICCHKPIFNSTNEDDLFNTSIVKVWFGDRNKIIQKPKSEYLRFYFAQVLQPWCSCKIPESNSLFAREKYSIGLAHFAEIYDRDNYYYPSFVSLRDKRGIS